MPKSLGYDVKERNIIVNSMYAQQNQPELFSFMEKNIKITSIDYAKLASDVQELLLRPALLVTFEMCKEEWHIVKDVGNEYKMLALDDKSEHCQICNAKIRFVFFIKNESTSVELRVGSECIKKYEIDRGNLRDFKALAAKQIEVKLRTQALYKLNSAYPELQDYIRSHINYLRYNTYVLNRERELQFSEKYRKLQSDVELFLEGTGKVKLENIGMLYSELQNIELEHKTFFALQEENPWALTRTLYQSIISNLSINQVNAREKLLITATISADSLQLFSDSKYRQMVLMQISEFLTGSEFHVDKISPDGSNVFIDFRHEHQNHKLIFSYIEFVNSYGQLLFDKNLSPINELDYLKKNSFKVDDRFYSYALSIIEKSFDNGIYFYRENGDIVITNESRAFLIFVDSDDQKCYMEIEFMNLIAKLYKSYILNDLGQILQWSQERKKNRVATNKLEDLHDIINAYNRGYIDDKRNVRKR